MASGATDREIADDLYVSVRTAQSHVSHILRNSCPIALGGVSRRGEDDSSSANYGSWTQFIRR